MADASSVLKSCHMPGPHGPVPFFTNISPGVKSLPPCCLPVLLFLETLERFLETLERFLETLERFIVFLPRLERFLETLEPLERLLAIL